MVATLEKALGEISKLPDSQQEAIAALIFEEIASEKKWDEQFANSQDVLAKLASEALTEFEQGKTRPLQDDSDLTHE